jgi:hypothetical protein
MGTIIIFLKNNRRCHGGISLGIRVNELSRAELDKVHTQLISLMSRTDSLEPKMSTRDRLLKMTNESS